MFFKIIAIFVILPLTGEVTANSAKCGAGKFGDVDSGNCKPCPNGTYMTAEMAAKGGQHACALCKRPDKASFEILAEPCTKTKDALIRCDEFHYRKNGSSSKDSACTPCGICGVGANSGRPHLKAPCHDYTDTVCCESDDMVVENGKCLRPTPFHPRQTGNTRISVSTNRTNEHIMRTIEHKIKPNENKPGTTEHVTRTTHQAKSQRDSGVILVSNSPIVLGAFVLYLFVNFWFRGFYHCS